MPDQILIVGCGRGRSAKDNQLTITLSDGSTRDIGHRPHGLRGITPVTVDIDHEMKPNIIVDFRQDVRSGYLQAESYYLVKFEKVPSTMFTGPTYAIKNAFYVLKAGGAVTIITGNPPVDPVRQAIENQLDKAGFQNIYIETYDQDTGLFAVATKPEL